MSSRRPTLLPLPTASRSATPPGPDSPLSARSRGRRYVTQNACVACRKKRTKCDGKTPCSRCIDRNIDCDYEAKASVSKDDLRAELRALKQERTSSRTVLQALLMDKYEVVVKRLRSGESIDAIAHNLGDETVGLKTEPDGDVRDRTPVLSATHHSEYGSPSDTGSTPEAGRAFVDVTQQFRAGQVAPVYISQHGDVASTKWLLTPMDTPGPTIAPSFIRPSLARRHSLDGIALNKDGRAPIGSTWTKVTPNREVVNHLVGLFFTWEFPLFTMVSQELFLRDYYHGSRGFCSPALVNAISSLATRYMQPDQATSPGDVDLLGETFFRESMGLLVQEARVPNLTSVQVFGLLAVREMSCGRELEAQELCLQAIRLLNSFDMETLGGNGQLTDHLTARSITFSGILAITRAIRIITDQLSPSSNYHTSRIPLASEPSAPEGESVANKLEERMGRLRDAASHQQQPASGTTLSSFVFEQTEHVYTFLARVRKHGKAETKDHLPAVFKRCLLSYDAFLVFLKEDSKTSPHTIFAHIYFQFGLLALCRPFVEYPLDVSGVSPRTICAEVVQTILDLTQSYASLFSLRQTPCFVPYFVFAAGLTRIALGIDGQRPSPEAGSPSTTTSSKRSSIQLHTLDGAGDIHMDEVDNVPSSLALRGLTMTDDDDVYQAGPQEETGLTQAVSQLVQMSAGHPAASQAGWVLRGFKVDHPEVR